MYNTQWEIVLDTLECLNAFRVPDLDQYKISVGGYVQILHKMWHEGLIGLFECEADALGLEAASVNLSSLTLTVKGMEFLVKHAGRSLDASAPGEKN
jgi:hypothetical protein